MHYVFPPYGQRQTKLLATPTRYRPLSGGGNKDVPVRQMHREKGYGLFH